MKGGQRWPPNERDRVDYACADRASMKGGQRWPPNHAPAVPLDHRLPASMKGGQRWPPNTSKDSSGNGSFRGFNEGRPALAAECRHFTFPMMMY